VTEKLGAAIFVLGILLAGFMVGVYSEPTHPGRFAPGFIVAGVGLLLWLVGNRWPRRSKSR
jgi:hypothetical protein